MRDAKTATASGHQRVTTSGGPGASGGAGPMSDLLLSPVKRQAVDFVLVLFLVLVLVVLVVLVLGDVFGVVVFVVVAVD